MKLHAIVRSACLLISIGCITAAYILAGYWLILLAIPAMMLLWGITKKESAFGAASSLFAMYMLLAAGGVLLKAQSVLIITGSIAALGWWDLSHFNESLVGEVPVRARALLEKRRLQSLALVSMISLLIVMLGTWVRLQLPFGVIALLVLLVTGGILYSAHQLRHSA